MQPRVFDENFPNTILYVGDVQAASGVWRNIFIADVTPPEAPHERDAREGGRAR